MDNLRETLVNLIIDAKRTDPETGSFTEYLADHLIANGVTFAEDINVPAKWIPVSERLPALHTEEYEEPDGSRTQVEESDDQWVINASGHQTKARYETGVVFQGWVGEYGETVRNVTHWMPLPEAPPMAIS